MRRHENLIPTLNGKRRFVFAVVIAIIAISTFELALSYPSAAAKCNPDFTITASPASNSVQQGSRAAFTVRVTSVCGLQSIIDWGIYTVSPSLNAAVTQPSYHFALGADGSAYNYIIIDTSTNTLRTTYTITFFGRAITGSNHQFHISNPVTLTVT